MGHAEIPPGLKILEITYSNFVTARALYAFAKLGLADQFDGEAKSSEELATSVGVDPKALYRLLRTLSMADVVTEAEDHRFTLGPVGEALRSDLPESMRAWAILSGEPFYLQAWEQIVHSIQTGQPAWEHVHKMPIFEYIGQHPEVARIFDQAMTSLSAAEAPAIVGAYDFSGIRKLADIGGGQGLLLRTILGAYPAMRGVLFDRPDAVAGLHELLAREEYSRLLARAGFDLVRVVPHRSRRVLWKLFPRRDSSRIPALPRSQIRLEVLQRSTLCLAVVDTPGSSTSRHGRHAAGSWERRPTAACPQNPLHAAHRKRPYIDSFLVSGNLLRCPPNIGFMATRSRRPDGGPEPRVMNGGNSGDAAPGSR